MATRVEKKYRTESLIAINNVFNYLDKYVKSKGKLAESERELVEDIATELDYFLNKNGISDEELRQAVERRK
jgi:hypothetical protein